MKYILLYLVLASDELPDLKPPTMKCKPKQQQQVSAVMYLSDIKSILAMPASDHCKRPVMLYRK